MVLEISLGLIGILAPSFLLVVVTRRWLDEMPWRVAALLMVLTLCFIGRVVVTTESPLPLDSAARSYPFRGVVGEVTAANSNTSETAHQILPWTAAVKTAFRAGKAPLWNRHSLSGHPLLGCGQAAPFSPFFLSTIHVPLPRQMMAMAALKVFAALFFGCLLLRREELGWWASVLGSMFFACSLFQVVFLYYPMTSVTALLPALLYAVSRLLDRPEPASTVLLALVTAGMLISGHPESVLHSALAAAGWLVLEAVAPRRPHNWNRALRFTTIAVLAGVLLSAPAWLPLLEQVPGSARADRETTHHRSGKTPRFAVEETGLLIDPDHFGHPARKSWAHRSNYAEKASFYMGLVPLVLFVPALVSRRSTRRDRLLVLGVGVTLLVAFDWTPVAHLLNSTSPFSLIANARLRFVAVLLAAIVASRSLENIERRDLPLLAVGTALVLAGWWVAGHHRVEDDPSLLGVAALLGLWAAIALRSIPRFRHIPVAAAAMPLIFLEMAMAHATFHPPREGRLFAPELPVVDSIRAHAAGGGPYRIVGRQWTLLPDLATHYGMEDIRGNDPMVSAAYIEVLDMTAPRHARWHNLRLIRVFPQPILDFLNVRYVLTDPGKRMPASFERLYSGPDGQAFHNPGALPRFFVPARLIGRGDGDLAELLRNLGDLGQTSLVGTLESGRKRENGRATLSAISGDGFGRFSLICDAEAPTLVASSVPAAPGWRLEIDGSRSPIEQVNGAFVGFSVPAGRSEITLRYRPWTFDVGLALSFLGLVLLVFTKALNHRSFIAPRAVEMERPTPEEAVARSNGSSS